VANVIVIYQHTLTRTEFRVREACIIVSGEGRSMKVSGADSLMMGSRVMFGKIISTIASSWFPKDGKLALAFAIMEPIKTHVHSFGVFLLDSIVDDPTGSVVVSLQQCGRLWMPQFFQSGADGADSLGIEE